MKSHFKRLGKDSLIYGVGGVISKGVGLFLLPVYTRIFRPHDYGIIEILSTFSGFLLSVLILGTDSALSFYFFKEKNNGPAAQTRIITSIFQWRILWGGFILILAILISPLLNTLFFKGALSLQLFLVAFCASFFAQLASQSIEIYRLAYRPWSFIGVNSGSLILSAAVTILLVCLLKLGVISFFIGLLVSWLIFTVIGLFSLRQYLDFSSWHFDLWPKILKFGLPMVPSALAMWIITSTDRLFINFYYSTNIVGIYAVAAKFALFIGFSMEIFRLAWMPISLDVMHAPEGPDVFRAISRFYVGVGMAGIIVLTALSPKLLQWFTVPAFYPAYPIVGVLAFSAIFFGFYLISSAGVWKAEKTWWVTVALMVAAVLNIIFNALLVPAYAGMGAAIASAMAMFIGNVVLSFISEKVWPIRLQYGIILAQIFIAIAAVCGILWLYALSRPVWIVVLITIISPVIILSLTIGIKGIRGIKRLIKRGSNGKNQEIL